MRTSNIVLAITLAFALNLFGQAPEKVDEFGRPTNDELSTRVKFFADKLESKGDSYGFIKLNGPKWLQYRYIRKIEGCNSWWKRRSNLFKFMLGLEQDELKIEFWNVPQLKSFDGFVPNFLDYRLPKLDKAIELTVSAGTDEYCPTIFDIEWFSKFMTANPSFKGKAIFDTSQRDFQTRVIKYRNQLKALGIDPLRVSFLRKHFYHERDEQWWIIPAKKRTAKNTR